VAMAIAHMSGTIMMKSVIDVSSSGSGSACLLRSARYEGGSWAP
jgi:hypothetical protein